MEKTTTISTAGLEAVVLMLRRQAVLLAYIAIIGTIALIVAVAR